MKVVVIGGDAAGASAASQIKRRLGESVEVTVLEKQSWTSYSACGIPYWIGGIVPGPEGLVARSPDQHRANGLDVRTATEAVSIDTANRVVRAAAVGGGDGLEGFPYDHLIIATGAVPLAPPVPGLDLPGVHRAQTLDDGLAAIDTLERRPRDAVVLGAGYIGLEMAEACVERGLTTTVVDLSPEPMRTIDPDMGARIREAMEQAGVVVRGSEPATAVRAGDDGRVAAVVTGEGEYPADIVFLGLGVRPRTELARAAGLPLGERDGILTDEFCRVEGFTDIWAGGDCVEVVDRILGSRRYVPLGTHANHHGRVIGLNISGTEARFPGVVDTSITKFLDLEVSRVGLREPEAREHGFDAVAVTIETKTRSGYMPGASRMALKLIAERGSGRVLGAQIVGGPGAGKRIDTIATAIWSSMTVGDLIDLDLAYAPPFSPVWDPVQTAAKTLFPKVRPGPGG